MPDSPENKEGDWNQALKDLYSGAMPVFKKVVPPERQQHFANKHLQEAEEAWKNPTYPKKTTNKETFLDLFPCVKRNPIVCTDWLAAEEQREQWEIAQRLLDLDMAGGRVIA